MAAKYRKNGRLPVVSWKHPRRNGFLAHAGIVQQSGEISEQFIAAAKSEDDKLIWCLIRNSNPNYTGSEEASHVSEPLLSTKLEPTSRKLSKKREKPRPKRTDPTLSHEIAEFYMVQVIQRQDACYDCSEWTRSQDISVAEESLYVDSLSDLKESYRKLHRLCTGSFSQTTEEHWCSALDNTRWLDQVRSVMNAAQRLIKLMEQGSSVLLTCDGWDRGCQLSALAQLWMDPFYRTLRGFIVLVEKEWLSFGHPFTDRSGILSQEDGPDVVPVFLQWLDCVWQTLLQFPNQFEFNNNFLIEIAEHVYSGRYGTFLFQSESARQAHLAGITTESLWTHVAYNYAYKNPFYVGKIDATIIPSSNPRSLTLWNSLYLRWYEGQAIQKLPRVGSGPCGQDIFGFTSTSLSEKQQLERHVLALETALNNIKREIDKRKDVLSEVAVGVPVAAAQHNILLRSRSKIVIDLLYDVRSMQFNPATLALSDSRLLDKPRRERKNSDAAKRIKKTTSTSHLDMELTPSKRNRDRTKSISEP